MKKMTAKTVPINWIDDTERYILVPRMERKRVVKKVKRLIKVKGACYFTLGVPLGLIDFIYRAVLQLRLKDRKFIFSRGAVKAQRQTDQQCRGGLGTGLGPGHFDHHPTEAPV